MNAKELEEVREYKHLGSTVCESSEMEAEVTHRMSKERAMMMGGSDHCCKSWDAGMQVFNMKCVRRVLELNIMDKIWNCNVRERYQNSRNMLEWIDQNIQKSVTIYNDIK